MITGSMKIRIRLLREDAVLPAYAHGPPEGGGLDLRAVEPVRLEPDAPHIVPTPLSVELAPDLRLVGRGREPYEIHAGDRGTGGFGSWGR